MKKKILFLLLAISLAACTSKGNPLTTTLNNNDLSAWASKNNPATERQLLQMLDKKDLFRLKTLFEGKRSELPQNIVLYLEANLQNAFNQTEQSLRTIDKLLGTYGKSLNDTLLYNIYVVKYDNLHKQYRYREATEALKIAMDKYGYAADSIDLAKMQEAYNAIKPLKGFPQQKIHITTDVTIPISLNQYNHMIINVTSNKQSENFIFDTGANTTKFSEKYFIANNDKIKEKSTPNTIRRGGIGGFVNSDTYELKNIQLKIGGRELTMPTIMVLTGKLSYLKNYDGHLGQDVLIHFNKLILNFEDMCLTFKD